GRPDGSFGVGLGGKGTGVWRGSGSSGAARATSLTASFGVSLAGSCAAGRPSAGGGRGAPRGPPGRPPGGAGGPRACTTPEPAVVPRVTVWPATWTTGTASRLTTCVQPGTWLRQRLTLSFSSTEFTLPRTASWPSL